MADRKRSRRVREGNITRSALRALKQRTLEPGESCTPKCPKCGSERIAETGTTTYTQEFSTITADQDTGKLRPENWDSRDMECENDDPSVEGYLCRSCMTTGPLDAFISTPDQET